MDSFSALVELPSFVSYNFGQSYKWNGKGLYERLGCCISDYMSVMVKMLSFDTV
jgi:hypothetical protein